MVGGLWHYGNKIPAEKLFMIASFVYFSLNFLNGALLFMDYTIMLGIQLVPGILTINSYNIRMSAVQSDVPSEKRGRVKGLFNILVPMGV